MYLSRIDLDIRHPSVRQALRDANDLHRNLMSGFGMDVSSRTARAEKRVLFRLYTRREATYLLVTSAEKPDPKSLEERGFYTDETRIRDVSKLKELFVPGRLLRFELLASPCKKVSGEGKNSRRYFLEQPEERAEWLGRKGQQGGFQVIRLEELGNRTDIYGHRRGAEVRNSAVLFSGILCISNQEAFWQSYTRGIGPGKAYGLGMLALGKV